MPFDKPAVAWTLRHRDGRTITGAFAFLKNGHVEAQVASDGTMIYSRSFEVGSDAMTWLEQEKGTWQESGT